MDNFTIFFKKNLYFGLPGHMSLPCLNKSFIMTLLMIGRNVTHNLEIVDLFAYQNKIKYLNR